MGYKTKSKQKTNKPIDTDNKMVVIRNEGGKRRTKRVKGVKYKVTKGV